MTDLYDWIKAFHVIAIIAWMAGALYLPRLFVYHCDVAPDSEASELFKIMERKLFHAITLPAMTVAWGLGLFLVARLGMAGHGWLHAKLGLAAAMTGYTMILDVWRRDFRADRNRRSARFFRVANELPTLLLVGIVILVIVKPF
jgi:putative membrane protein